MEKTDLTPKAQHTRQHILETALDLFATQGYDATTMREIADTAGCSLGLTYRYFVSKEELILALYGRMAEETAAQIASLENGTIAERFHGVMTTRLAGATPYRDALGALLGATANPNSGVSVLGPAAGDMRDVALESFMQLVSKATDTPRAQHTDSIAKLLHSLHFLLLLFWLYDRSPDRSATGDLLDFIRDTLGLLRPMLILPMVSNSLTRFADIVGAVFAPPSD